VLLSGSCHLLGSAGGIETAKDVLVAFTARRHDEGCSFGGLDRWNRQGVSQISADVGEVGGGGEETEDWSLPRDIESSERADDIVPILWVLANEARGHAA